LGRIDRGAIDRDRGLGGYIGVAGAVPVAWQVSPFPGRCGRGLFKHRGGGDGGVLIAGGLTAAGSTGAAGLTRLASAMADKLVETKASVGVTGMTVLTGKGLVAAGLMEGALKDAELPGAAESAEGT
jgi:hypothetical protein